MEIQNIKIAALKPYQNNARTHSAKQVEEIARSIRFVYGLAVYAGASNSGREVIFGIEKLSKKKAVLLERKSRL